MDASEKRALRDCLDRRPELAQRESFKALLRSMASEDAETKQKQKGPRSPPVAKKAVEKSSVELPIILDTFAEALYANGQKQRSLEVMEKVLSMSSKKVFKDNYQRFKSGR